MTVWKEKEKVTLVSNYNWIINNVINRVKKSKEFGYKSVMKFITFWVSSALPPVLSRTEVQKTMDEWERLTPT